mgnify:CR=1 FL=1
MALCERLSNCLAGTDDESEIIEEPAGGDRGILTEQSTTPPVGRTSLRSQKQPVNRDHPIERPAPTVDSHVEPEIEAMDKDVYADDLHGAIDACKSAPALESGPGKQMVSQMAWLGESRYDGLLKHFQQRFRQLTD